MTKYDLSKWDHLIDYPDMIFGQVRCMDCIKLMDKKGKLFCPIEREGVVYPIPIQTSLTNWKMCPNFVFYNEDALDEINAMIKQDMLDSFT